MSSPNPAPAYPAKDNAVLFGDTALYKRLGAIAESKDHKTLIEEFEIPIRSGRAWVVKKGASRPSWWHSPARGLPLSLNFHMSSTLPAPEVDKQMNLTARCFLTLIKDNSASSQHHVVRRSET